ncbi:DUF4123 domain-containing protein [Spirosoma spitsbergense]|uniref:DUF4123 domain-containing protein n=1 Tax=Spirosoma spitsbergense TaxID=431554 RepID=UPI0003998AD0|nr:DUF4123 domain-containing protein [Spirosoma spitsbergense]
MRQTTTHLLLDAARMGSIMKEAKELNKEHSSLYKGQSEEYLAEFAPYIFSVYKNTPFGPWFTEKGWGNSWGIFLQSPVPAKDVYQHFRKFLLVKTEDGRELCFRFYDPRVLRIFLPTCDQQQLVEFFGPVRHFFMEDEDPEYGLYFWLENGELRTQKSPKSELEKIFKSKSKS